MSTTIRITLDDLKAATPKLCDGSEDAFLAEFPSGVMEGVWDEAALALLCGSRLGAFVNWGINVGLLPVSPSWGKPPKQERPATVRKVHHAADVRNPRAGSEPCRFRGRRCAGKRQGQCLSLCQHPDRGGTCNLRECMACGLYEA